MNRQRLQRGFTLIELLVAMSLLATIGALLVQLIRQSFDLYEQGDRRGDLYEAGLHVMELVESDLMATAGPPNGRLLLQSRDGGEGFTLRLVRSIPDTEQQHHVLRRAGAATSDDPVNYLGEDPGIQERDKIAPPSGLMEVLYVLLHDEKDPPGILTLYRGERAPIGGADSFFARESFEDEWVRKTLQPVANDVLGLWVLCMSQVSEEWDEEVAMEGRARSGASFPLWDSTRGLFPKHVFPLARGGGSLNDPRDDVFPRRIRIVLQVGRGWAPDARLVRSLPPGGKQIDVNHTRLLPAEYDSDRSIKVGGEWLLMGDGGSGWARVTRGTRGTSGKADHPVGTPVFSGRLFRKTFDLPVARSHWLEAGR